MHSSLLHRKCYTFQDPQKISVYPDVTYTGDHPASSSCASVKFKSLTPPVLNISEAVELAFCAYWAFNTEYAPLIKNTFLLMEILFGLNPFLPSVTAEKAAMAICVQLDFLFLLFFFDQQAKAMCISYQFASTNVNFQIYFCFFYYAVTAEYELL